MFDLETATSYEEYLEILTQVVEDNAGKAAEAAEINDLALGEDETC